jgi:hypothetical protein
VAQPKQPTTRVTTISLPSSVIKKIAKDLGFNNIKRIPKKLVVTAISRAAAEQLKLGTEPVDHMAVTSIA